jgi:hypothetical protein
MPVHRCGRNHAIWHSEDAGSGTGPPAPPAIDSMLFRRLAYEEMCDISRDLLVQREAFDLLHAAAEGYMSMVFHFSNMVIWECTIAGRGLLTGRNNQ